MGKALVTPVVAVVAATMAACGGSEPDTSTAGPVKGSGARDGDSMQNSARGIAEKALAAL